MSNTITNAQHTRLWWVPDDTEVWSLADQTSDELPNGCVNFMVHKTRKLVTLPMEKCLPADKDMPSPEDLVFLPDVNPANILICSRNRFADRRIYTSIGQVLMSINPFEVISGLYGRHMIQRYIDVINERNARAHVYMIPSRAYQNMCATGRDQSILISGESGAGKTEAAKHCLAFLTEVANHSTHQPQKPKQPNDEDDFTVATSSPRKAEIAERIIAASPILEAFGNAKTSRNPNSSRFGKWMVLNFDRHNVIQSSNIISYLLEKSRVTQRDPKERNYHIFYQLIRGMAKEQLRMWDISSHSTDYRYLVADGHDEAVDLNDAKVYKQTYNSFLKMGFSLEETMQYFKLVLAVLELGNITFGATREGEGSEIKNPSIVEQIAKKLCVSPQILSFSLCNRSIESGKSGRKSIINIQLNVQKALETRDTLARSIYDKLFSEIIVNINAKSKADESITSNPTDRCIGLLDIFGFEIFVENSFEQLCINYCNECLQNHFNYVIFISEKKLYDSESIVVETFEFRDNIEVIRDIESTFKALDEEARIPKGSSKTWFDKLKRGGIKSPNVSFPPRKTGDVFVIKHYAGDVDYNAVGFLEKNIETINNDLVGAMTSSTDPLIFKMFSKTAEPLDTAPMPSARLSVASRSGDEQEEVQRKPLQRKASNASMLNNRSLSWRFTSQLTSLMNMLKQTESHFIRCIKSNDSCTPQTFDAVVVYKQLIYSGIFEVVKIQQSGLPCRLPHYDFLHRYKCLAPSHIRYNIRSAGELLHHLTRLKFDLSHVKIGVSLIFLKSHEQRLVEVKRDELFKYSSSKISSNLLMRYVRYYFRRILGHYKAFQQANEDLVNKPATESYNSLVVECEDFHRLLRRKTMQHLIKKVKHELDLLDRRVELIEEAKVRLEVRTTEGILALDEMISRGIELEITFHPVIVACKTRMQKYYRTLEFMEIVHQTFPILKSAIEQEKKGNKSRKEVNTSIDRDNVVTMHSLSVTQMEEGIEILTEYLDFVQHGAPTLEAALSHKDGVHDEAELIMAPLQYHFRMSASQYDPSTGNLIMKFDDDGFNHYQQLKEMVRKHDSYPFLSQDNAILFEDAKAYVILLEEYVACNDVSYAMDHIRNSACNRPENVVFQEQMDEFHKWAEIQLSPNTLRDYLVKGYVPKADVEVTSDEKVASVPGSNLVYVNYTAIDTLVKKLQMLTRPSPTIESVIKAGTWMVQLRRAFLAKDWDMLEEVVVKADMDGVNNFVFDDFPDCIEELNNCQWQVIYHGFLGDLLFAVKEPVFQSIPLDAKSWYPLVKNLKEDMSMLDDIRSFGDPEISPKLLQLCPILESILQLRSLVYAKDMEYAILLKNSLISTHQEAVTQFELKEALEAEILHCQKLIDKYYYEEDLMHILQEDQAIPYPFPPENIETLAADSSNNTSTNTSVASVMTINTNSSLKLLPVEKYTDKQMEKYINNHPSYVSLYNMSEAVSDLKQVLQQLESLSPSYHHQLMVRIEIAKVLLYGREVLTLDEVAAFKYTTHPKYQKPGEDKGMPNRIINKIDWAGKLKTFTEMYHEGREKESNYDGQPPLLNIASFSNDGTDESKQDAHLYLETPIPATPSASGLKKVENFVSLWDQSFEEYSIIRNELHRRIIVQDLFSILFIPTIVGKVDIDLHVEEARLIEQYNSFNAVMKRVQDSQFDQNHYPLNLQALIKFTYETLRLRKCVLDKIWDATHLQSIIELMEVKRPHGGAMYIPNIQTEIQRVRDELYAQECIKKLRHELESIQIKTNDDYPIIVSKAMKSVSISQEASATSKSSQSAPLPPSSQLAPSSSSQLAPAIITTTTSPTKSPTRKRNSMMVSAIDIDLSPLQDSLSKMINQHQRRELAKNPAAVPYTSSSNADMRLLSKTSQQLVYLAESLIDLIQAMLRNEMQKISNEMLEKTLKDYEALHLKVNRIEGLFQRVRVHNFFKQLCELLLFHQERAGMLYEELNKFKQQILTTNHTNTVPAQFIPWLQASYLFCELSHSLYQDKHWVTIVEIGRKLDDFLVHSIQPVLLQASTIAKENPNSQNYRDMQTFLDIIHAFKAYAYQSAIAMKGDEDVMKVQRKVKTYSPSEAEKALIRAEDLASNPYGIGNLRKAGFSDIKLLNELIPVNAMYQPGVPRSIDPKLFWAYNVDPLLLRKKKYYSVRQLLAAGYTDIELYKAGYSIADLYEGGVSVDDFLDMGLTLECICQSGGLDGAIKGIEKGEQVYLHTKSLSPTTIMRHVGADPHHLAKIGLSLNDLIQANMTVVELRSIGFTAEEIYRAGVTEVEEFVKAGFHLDKLITVFPLSQLRQAGYSFEELFNYGIHYDELLRAGFVEEVERKVLTIFFQATNGELWYARQHWLEKNRPLKQWYGITVHQDELNRDRIVAIDLINNNMQGTLPIELIFLQCLKRLRISGNKLLPPSATSTVNQTPGVMNSTFVHEKLHQFIVTNQVMIDITLFSNAHGMNANGNLVANVGGMATPMITKRIGGGTGPRLLPFTPFKTDDHQIPPPPSISESPKLTRIPSNSKLNVPPELLNGPLTPSKAGPKGGIALFPARESFTLGKPPIPPTPSTSSTTTNPSVPIAASNTVISKNLFEACFEQGPTARDLLMDFYHALNGSKWKRNDHWGSDEPVTKWYGVKIIGPGSGFDGTTYPPTSIVEICLPENNLCGTLSEVIGSFTNLKVLDLRINHISGYIPPEIGQCIHLKKLLLQSNKLRGLIPGCIGDLIDLEQLDLRYNMLHGEIPPSLTNIRDLHYLGLYSNRFQIVNAQEVKKMFPACKIIL